jgi:hypothetical protein
LQRKQKDIGSPLPPVTLFLDDLEKIVSIVQQVSDNIEIETDEYTLTGLQDLQKLKAEFINDLTFRCYADKDPIRKLYGPILAIRFKDDQAYLILAKETPAFRGILAEVRDFIMSRRRKWSRLTLTPTAPLIAGMLAPFVMLIGGMGKVGYVLALPVFGAIELICIIWGWWTLHQKYSVIFLKRHTEAPSFWVRNRDQILVAILASLLTFLATLGTKVLLGF